MNKIVPIRDNSTADIADALVAEIDSMWGLSIGLGGRTGALN
jgi:hypothetical protein